MKLLTPSIKDCRYIHRKLKQYYNEQEYIGNSHPDTKEFKRALVRFAEFYKIDLPTVVWYLNINNGKTLGQCHEDGRVFLITPSAWKFSRDLWCKTVYHELGHYVLWARAEPKAEAFADRMMEKWRK